MKGCTYLPLPAPQGTAETVEILVLSESAVGLAFKSGDATREVWLSPRATLAPVSR